MSGRTWEEISIKILIADDHAIMREGLKVLLEKYGLKVPRVAKNGREILQLIAEGETTKKIAKKMYISIKTVESHRRNIMKKLDIYSVAGLTRFAIKERLISLE